MAKTSQELLEIIAQSKQSTLSEDLKKIAEQIRHNADPDFESIEKTPDKKIQIGETAWLVACKNRETGVEILKYLEQIKPRTDQQIKKESEQEVTPLINAAITDNVSVIQYLVNEKKVDIHKLTENGDNALILALANGKFEAAKLLLTLGADPMKPSYNGFTPLDYARESGSFELVKFLEEQEKKLEQQDKKRYDEYKAFNDKAKLIKFSAGHPLGVKTQIPLDLSPSLKHPNMPLRTKAIISTEEGISYCSSAKVSDYLKDYIDKRLSKEVKEGNLDIGVKQHFEAIAAAVQLETSRLSYEHPNALNELVESAKTKNKLTYIPCGWEGHDVSIARYGDFLLVTNRGEGKLKSGAMLYKLKKDVNWNEDLIKSFRPEGARASRKVIQERILGLVDDAYAGIPIMLSPQKRGNCSFANRKSNIEPALMAFKLMALEASELEKIFEDLRIAPSAPTSGLNQIFGAQTREELEEEALKKLEENPSFVKAKFYAEKQYKRFTRFIRDDQIHTLIKDFKKAKSEGAKDKSELYITLFGKYLQEHFGKPRSKKRGEVPKAITELERAELILKSLSDEERSAMLKTLSHPGASVMAKKELFNNAKENGFYGLIKLVNPAFDPNSFDLNGKTLLIEALAKGNVDHLKELFQHFPNTDPERADKFGNTPQVLAANKPELLKIISEQKKALAPFIQARAEILNIIDTTHKKSWPEDQKRIEALLLPKAPLFFAVLNEKNGSVDSLLTLAARKGEQDPELSVLISQCLVKYLENNALEVDELSKMGDSAAMIACRQGNLELLKLILKKGAHILQQDRHLNSLLLMAVQQGHLPVVEFLLQNTASNINLANDKGLSPLTFAVSSGNLAMVQLLLKNDNMQKYLHNDIHHSVDAINMALRNNHSKVAQYLFNHSPYKDQKGFSMLNEAATKELPLVIKFLMQQKTVVNQIKSDLDEAFTDLISGTPASAALLLDLLPPKDDKNETLLAKVIRYGTLNHAKHLLENPKIVASINDMDLSGHTPLTLAITQQNEGIAKLLLETGADPLVVNAQGQTPRELARDLGFYDLANLIAEKEKVFFKTNEELYQQFEKYSELCNRLIYDLAQPLGLQAHLQMAHPLSKELLLVKTNEGTNLPSLEKNIDLSTYFSASLSDPLQRKHFSEIQEALRVEASYLQNPEILSPLLKMLNQPEHSLVCLPLIINGEPGSLAIYGDKDNGKWMVVSYVDWDSQEIKTSVFKLKDKLQWNEALVKELVSDTTSLNNGKKILEPLVDKQYDSAVVYTSPWQMGMHHFWTHHLIQPGIRFLQSLFSLPKEVQPKKQEMLKLNKSVHVELIKTIHEEQQRYGIYMQENSLDSLMREYISAQSSKSAYRIQLYTDLIQDFILAHHGDEKPGEPHPPYFSPQLALKNMVKLLSIVDEKIRPAFVKTMVDKASGKALKFHPIDHAIKYHVYELLPLMNPDWKVNRLIKDKTLLMKACQENNLGAVNALFRTFKDLDPDFKDRRGKTALMYAVEKGNLGIVKTLIAHHANVNAQDNRGLTVMDFAVKKGQPDMITFLKTLPDIKFTKELLYRSPDAEGVKPEKPENPSEPTVKPGSPTSPRGSSGKT